MFSDASLTGYVLVLTQVLNWQDGAPVEEQQHELLICRGGLFKNAQKNWSIVEKEGYPIVKACGRTLHARRTTHQRKAVVLGVEASGLSVCDSSHSWRDQPLGGYNFSLGPAAPSDASEPLAVCQVTTRSAQILPELRPLQSDQFAWPTRAEIIRVQQQYHGDAPGSAVATDDGFEVLKRLFVVAHCGIQGHRGVNVMVELLDRRFVLLNARQICLLCKHVKGGQVIQRIWTMDRPVAKRNECLHLDYLYLGDSYDKLTHYCELVPADAADSQTVVAAILDWNERFGVPPSWMSDNGSHFKNEVMELLAERLGASHQFAPV
ncbi:hypothetical protein PHMEG_00015487 [Phytophthora megakarya]|uniref:Integrase catalytic domain-containing protein n=1 Tax=Phytophthora megakarya TaxID=4795 RepID=A0A225W1M8_9STRA|nr:hypothetical protein PHMEG_00015487 [Phytophthora megakarya]